ncbi:MAG: helix-turn-helix transcriptional regulator [Candidatus Cloacimonetes bacterium]|nr:helix-turn-helix transcriptional regulator [Candidatus Cloacimonadota bacterium]
MIKEGGEMANSKKVWLHKHNESAKELNIDFSLIPKWKRDLIDIVAELSVKRIKLRMTQDELAKKMGVKQPVVARFEHMGRTPGLESIYKYAEGLGVELKPLQFAEAFRFPKPEDEEEDYPAELYAPWQKNVYGIVADLAVYRIKQRVSQAELAKRMGTSQSVITRFERMGRIPTIEFIYKVAAALGVELEGLKVIEVQQRSIEFACSSDSISVTIQSDIVSNLVEQVIQCNFDKEMDTTNITEFKIYIPSQVIAFEKFEISNEGIDCVVELNSSDESQNTETLVFTKDYLTAA